jgi:hypothetical protein
VAGVEVVVVAAAVVVFGGDGRPSCVEPVADGGATAFHEIARRDNDEADGGGYLTISGLLLA